ncbi:hypothetical protein KXV85_005056, partial [Aspergillus fumigatus]
QGPALAPHGCRRRHRDRPVSRGRHRRPVSPRLCRRTGQAFGHRDFRGDQGAYRQLALEGRALLSAHRQGTGPQAHGGCDQVQAGPAVDVLGDRGRQSVAELPDHRHRTDRDHRAAVQRQGSGPQHQHRRGRDEVPLRRLFPRRSLDGLRDADLRLHDRRQHPVSARRR